MVSEPTIAISILAGCTAYALTRAHKLLRDWSKAKFEKDAEETIDLPAAIATGLIRFMAGYTTLAFGLHTAWLWMDNTGQYNYTTAIMPRIGVEEAIASTLVFLVFYVLSIVVPDFLGRIKVELLLLWPKVKQRVVGFIQNQMLGSNK